MTIQKAIKSGKPFRRKGWPTTHYYVDKKRRVSEKKYQYLFWHEDGYIFPQLTRTDILATDWEVKK